MFPWTICGLMLLVIVILILKILIMKQTIKEICEELQSRLSEDTNTLISISSGDKNIKKLATELNRQLYILRRERQIYLNGDRELKDAVTNISHDLRTPLTAICGYLQLLEKEEKSREAERYIGIIEGRIATMKQLTEELFRYSVIISGNTEENKEKLSLNDILEESIATFYVPLSERGIVPSIKICEKRITRELDRSKMLRIFSNIIENALKYSDGDLAITLSEQGRITFENTASLLSEIKVGRLFDRFYTVETAGSSTGLGLAIARTLIERMGGRIDAEYLSGRLIISIDI